MSRKITIDKDVVINLHDPGEALSDHIDRERDFFEREILDYIRMVYPVQKTILDVGANIGNHTLYFAKYLKHDAIVAFEPIPANFKLLSQNTAGLQRVFLRREAVGDSNIDVMLRENLSNMGACEVDPEGSIMAHQVRLSDIFVPEVSLIKIDVEWYEPQVLEGATTLLEEDRPLILIEDAKQEYAELLPDFYRLMQAWPDHKTYLYGPI